MCFHGACTCLAFNSKKKFSLNTEMHENAPYGAGAFKKISDDDQKIYSKNFIF